MNMNNSVKAVILFACGFAAAAVTLPALSFSGSADKSSDKSSNKSSDKASSTVAPSSISTSTSTAPAPAPEAPAQKAQSTTTKYTLSQVAKTIDHALLKPEMAKEAVLKGCELAARYGVASVCCKPADVVLCVNTLEMHKSDVLVGTVVGFPHGASTTETKVFETSLAVKQGAVEIDMVINIGLLKGGQLKKLQEEIEAITLACNNKAIVKVILENAYLTDDEIITACEIVEKAGAAAKADCIYVKTSTGFASHGAKLEHVELMYASIKDHSKVKVKSAGGVRTLDQLLSYMDAGVTRSGASATAEMLDEFRARFPHACED